MSLPSTEQPQGATLLRETLNLSNNGISLFEVVYGDSHQIENIRLVTLNEQAELLFGVCLSKVEGKLLTEINPGIRSHPDWEKVIEVAKTGVSFRESTFTTFPFSTPNKYLEQVIRPWQNGLALTYSEHPVSRNPLSGAETDPLAGFLDSSMTGINVYQPLRDEAGRITDFRIVHYNKAALTMSGFTEEQVREGQTLFKLYPVQEKYLPTLTDVIETGTSYTEDHHYSVTGAYLRATASRFGDDLIISYEDVTREHQQRREIKQQARLFRSVLDSMLNGLLILKVIRNADGALEDVEYLTVSQSIEQHTGIPVSSLTGTRMLSHFPMAIHSEIWRRYQTLLETGIPQVFEEHYKADGLDIWMYVSVSLLDKDTILANYLPISKLKEYQQELDEQNQLLRSLIYNAPIGIALFTPERDESGTIRDLRFVLTNPANTRYANTTPEAVIGRLNTDVFPWAAEVSMQQRLIQTVEQQQEQRFKLLFKAHNADVWIYAITIPFGNDVLLIYHDITEIEKSRQQLEISNRELTRTNENLQQFAYVASHDLQEPLRKIRAFGDILETQYGQVVDEAGIDLIRRMQSAATRMAYLVQDLLTYSRLTTNRQPKIQVDLNELVERVRTELEPDCKAVNALVTVEPLPSVSGEPAQLFQLLFGLLSNALKFHKPGVRPEITISHQVVWGQDIPGSDYLDKRLRYLQLDVRDNGIGFDPAYTNRIFTIFQRLHGQSKYPGTGIGLAICKKVVDNHGGHLTASSQPGQGATFTAYLPL